MTKSPISRTVASVAVIFAATVFLGCASDGPKVSGMEEFDLLSEVQTTQLNDWKSVGGQDWSGVDALGTGLVQDARKNQTDVKALGARLDADGPLAVFERSVDAELADRGISKPTAAQRQQVQEEILNAMDSDRRVALRASLDADQKLIAQREKDLDTLATMLVQITAQVNTVARMSKGSTTDRVIGAVGGGAAVKSAMDQIAPIQRLNDVSKELLTRYKFKLGFIDDAASGAVTAERQRR
jgi:hypothetical protein